ncbi:MAG: glutamine--fructose-6-phosphate transaminase (isomerizing) [Bacteroidales bacterium]|nr:glutamine--fructose-6-phosphate transaminase (isomerizing) [Bacteroidales bacterium]
MCGIVSYIGPKQAYPLLINGLKRLEYRGYDSSGIALINNDGLCVYKSKGKIADLEENVKNKNIEGTIGIAHTRWATHGEPNNVNAHPHFNETMDLALVHNGIIENYDTLKVMLKKNGYHFQTETDSEVLVQLIDFMRKKPRTNLLKAVQLALASVVGAYAIVLLDKNNPNQLIAARKSSPLVIGIGDNEYFVGSDATPFLDFTKKVIYVGDEEVVVIPRRGDIMITTLDNTKVDPIVQHIEMDITALEKGGFDHFMLKEIYEQPESIMDTMRGRINVEDCYLQLGGIMDYKEKLINAKRIIIVACGTSWHAGLLGEYLIENLARIPVEVEYASEFRYRNAPIFADDIVIAISQSGETADTLAAIELAKKKGATVLGICNVVGSSIARATNAGSYTHAGQEIGVASTKAFTSQVTLLILMSLMIADGKGILEKNQKKALIQELMRIPEKIRKVLEKAPEIQRMSEVFTFARNFLYLGRAYNYPVAMEGALKLKEISYIHAEGYPSAEMKHGPIALIDKETPVVFIATTPSNHQKNISNIQEIKARQGRVISIILEGDEEIKRLSDFYIEIPDTEEEFTPLISVVPLQLIAYYIAVARKCNVDQPRNLAKSVTVE